MALGSCLLGDFEIGSDAAEGGGGSAGAIATGGTTNAGGAGGVGGCVPGKWAAPPAMNDPSNDAVDFVVALQSLEFGDRIVSAVQGSNVGYDRDGACSCATDEPTCTPPEWVNEPICDGADGIDNAFAGIVAAFSQYQVTGDSFAQAVTDGLWSLLVRVGSYNGQPNDTDVTVAVYSGARFASDPCNGSAPAWDGADRWPIDAASVLGSGGGGDAAGGGGTGGGGASQGGGGASTCPPPSNPLLESPAITAVEAYVVDGQLVASFSTLRLVPSADVPPTEIAFDLRLKDGILTGRLVEGAGGWQIDEGVISGKWAEADIFDGLSETVKTGIPLCTSNPIYGIVKRAICSQLDLTTDFTDTCDSVSFGAAFEARPASLGILLPPVQPSTCMPGFDPANDDCSVEPD